MRHPVDVPAASRVALVTGAGRGIGRACAVRLARAGYRVGITARSIAELDATAALVGAAGGEACPVPGDLTLPADVTRVCARIADELGPLDTVVNNAAYPGPMTEFLQITDADWTAVLQTNVLGPVRVLREVLPGMLARGRGYVVNVNSLQGSDTAGSPLCYGVSKAALMRLTDGLAEQLSGQGVIVVDLSPGLVRTRMTSGRPDLDALPETAWAAPEDAAEQLVRLVSGRYDALHGRFVRAVDDLDELLARVAGDPDARVLRLQAREIARAG